MRRDGFMVGDRVGVLPEYGPVGNADVDPESLFGTICALHPNGRDCGVEFDVDINGHTCRHNSRERHGWYINPQYLFHETDLSSIPPEAILEVLSSG